MSTQSSDTEDSALLGTIRDLSERLSAKFVPTGIVWTGTLGRPLDLPSDQIVPVIRGSKRGRVLFPSVLKGRLSTEEWRPLISSALILYFLPQTRHVWRFSRVLRTLFFTSIFTLIIIYLIIRVAFGSVELLQFLLPVWLVLQIIFYFLIHTWDLRVIRPLRLKADRLAVQIVGLEEFIHTLEKIDSMKIEDVEENKTRRKTIWTVKGIYIWPNISERLGNLYSLRSVNSNQN